jgi:hypothetical protein
MARNELRRALLIRLSGGQLCPITPEGRDCRSHEIGKRPGSMLDERSGRGKARGTDAAPLVGRLARLLLPVTPRSIYGHA